MKTSPAITAAGGFPGRPARPGGDAYWARIDAIVDQAPTLTDEQRVAIRTAIWGGSSRRAAA